MIFAIMNDKKIKASHDLPYVREGARYFCTNKFCDHPELILKKGSKKFPHFAHKKKAQCVEPEPETIAHIKMKESLQLLLNISNEFVEYGKIKGVRPDLLYNNKYAIEVQHSPISEKEVKRRNQIYLKNRLIPIWLFHTGEIPNYDIKESGPYLAVNNFYELGGRNVYEYKLKDIEVYFEKLFGYVLYFKFQEIQEENFGFIIKKIEFEPIERESEWIDGGEYDPTTREFDPNYEYSSSILKTVKIIKNQSDVNIEQIQQLCIKQAKKMIEEIKLTSFCQRCGKPFQLKDPSEKSWKKLCIKCYKEVR